MIASRVGTDLNTALHRVFADDDSVLLLGEDVLDPYGGAFKVTAGLSDRYPDRVLTTPLSENGIVGVANGLALRGNKVIVEIMFGDFVLLALDQIVNFAAKSVSMYGRPVALRVLVRCPIGGRRGYGATHSQSVQRFFQGVPDLQLWELTPFVGAHAIVERALGDGRPAVLFEDKVLYTQRMLHTDDDWQITTEDGPCLWSTVRAARESHAPELVIVTTGGLAHIALDALHRLAADGVAAMLLSPARLQPLDVEPVLASLATAGAVLVVEDTGGGSWGADLAARLTDRLWGELRAPVALLASAPTPIPAASHLERAALVGVDDVVAAAHRLRDRAALSRPGAATADVAALTTVVSAPAAAAEPSPPPGAPAAGRGHEVRLPTLNANDERVVLVEWLHDTGDTVAAGDVIATVETSKASGDLEVDEAGVLTRVVTAGEEYLCGTVVALVGPTVVDPVAEDPPDSDVPANSDVPTPVDGSVPTAKRPISVQDGVAAAVTRSHRSIPAAFVATEVTLDATRRALAEIAAESGAVVDLDSFCLAALGELYAQFEHLFTPLDVDGRPAGESAPHIAVTIDAGAGLYLPVLRECDTRGLEDLADDLTMFKMDALAGRYTADQFVGAGIGASLTLVEDITLVQPLIMPGQCGMVSFGGTRTGADGEVLAIGFAYDHRVVNGRPAAEFVRALAGRFRDPEAVARR